MPAIGAAPNSPNRPLPKFIGSGMHEIVIEHMDEDDIDIGELETIEVYFNRKEELLRIDDTETNSRMIYNGLARSLCQISDGICTMSLVNGEVPEEQNLKLIRQLLDNIENSQTLPFKYLGQEIVQQLICDVFEHRSVDDEKAETTIRVVYVKHVS